MNDEIKPSEWINARLRNQPVFRPHREPEVDPEVSKAVGRNVLVNDHRLIKKVAEWSRMKDPNKPDNFLKDPQKVEELKKIFNG